jgi:hypothetical protein
MHSHRQDLLELSAGIEPPCELIGHDRPRIEQISSQGPAVHHGDLVDAISSNVRPGSVRCSMTMNRA